MPPGVKPRPTHLKVLEGVQNKKRINDKEPKPFPKAPDPPKFLDHIATNEWKRIAPELEKLGLLTGIDMSALAAYCDQFSRWVQATEKIQNEGMIISAPSGYPVQSPYLSIANKALDSMKKFLTEFGMTPSSRTRIRTNAGDDDTGEELLS